MAGLFYKGNLDGSTPERRKLIIANSQTVYRGSIQKFTDANFVTPVTAGDRMGFYVEDIVTKDGYPIWEAESSEYDGTITTGGIGVGAYAASADNQTDKQVKVIGFFLSEMNVFASVPDATLGTTTGSDSLGYYTDLINSYTIDEDTATTSAAQFAIIGIDPNSTTKGLYVPAERQFTR